MNGISHLGLGIGFEVKTKVLGGDLPVAYHKIGNQFTNVYLRGKVEKGFEGNIHF